MSVTVSVKIMIINQYANEVSHSFQQVTRPPVSQQTLVTRVLLLVYVYSCIRAPRLSSRNNMNNCLSTHGAPRFKVVALL